MVCSWLGPNHPIYLYFGLGLSHNGRSKEQWMVSLVILQWCFSTRLPYIQLSHGGFQTAELPFWSSCRTSFTLDQSSLTFLSCISPPIFCSNPFFIPIIPYLYPSLSGVVMMRESLTHRWVPSLMEREWLLQSKPLFSCI